MPPTRQPGHSPGPRLTAAPALASALRPRRCSSGDSDRDSPASLRSRSRGAASSSLPVPLFRLISWSRVCAQILTLPFILWGTLGK